MAKHKKWKDYTTKDVSKIIEERCIKCPYASGVQWRKSYGITAITCDFIGIAGHSRGCKPDECKHYLDDPKQVKKIREEHKRHAHIYANEVNTTRKRSR